MQGPEASSHAREAGYYQTYVDMHMDIQYGLHYKHVAFVMQGPEASSHAREAGY